MGSMGPQHEFNNDFWVGAITAAPVMLVAATSLLPTMYRASLVARRRLLTPWLLALAFLGPVAVTLMAIANLHDRKVNEQATYWAAVVLTCSVVAFVFAAWFTMFLARFELPPPTPLFESGESDSEPQRQGDPNRPERSRGLERTRPAPALVAAVAGLVWWVASNKRGARRG